MGKQATSGTAARLLRAGRTPTGRRRCSVCHREGRPRSALRLDRDEWPTANLAAGAISQQYHRRSRAQLALSGYPVASPATDECHRERAWRLPIQRHPPSNGFFTASSLQFRSGSCADRRFGQRVNHRSRCFCLDPSSQGRQPRRDRGEVTLHGGVGSNDSGSLDAAGGRPGSGNPPDGAGRLLWPDCYGHARSQRVGASLRAKHRRTGPLQLSLPGGNRKAPALLGCRLPREEKEP